MTKFDSITYLVREYLVFFDEYIDKGAFDKKCFILSIILFYL